MANVVPNKTMSLGNGRLESRTKIRRKPSSHHRIVVLGEEASCLEMIGALQKVPLARRQIDLSIHTPDRLDDLVRLARARAIDEVLILLRGFDEELLAQSIERLAACPIDISVGLGPLSDAVAGLAHRSDPDDLPRLILVRQPMRGRDARLKRAIDIILSGLLLLILAPFLCLVALAIKLDSPGPFIFRQTRNGLDQQDFLVWKFRTMHIARDEDESGAWQATRRDPRITRLGRLLRQSSIDELPQLVNVLRGEMSLVGPRPHPVSLDERFADKLKLYAARHRVLPGMTGLAQINGCRGETDTADKMAARLHYDLEYIRAWSLWLDVKIMVATLCGRFVHPNAY